MAQKRLVWVLIVAAGGWLISAQDATPTITPPIFETPLVIITETPTLEPTFTETPINTATTEPTFTLIPTLTPIPSDTSTLTPEPSLTPSATADVFLTPSLTIAPTLTPTIEVIVAEAQVLSPTPAPGLGLNESLSVQVESLITTPVNPVVVTAATVTELINQINAANSRCPSPTVITLTASLYLLTSVTDSSFYGDTGLPIIRCDITLNGIPGSLSTIERTGSVNFRIFGVDDPGTLRLNYVGVRGGSATATGGSGILSVYGDVQLYRSQVVDNTLNISTSFGIVGAGIYSYYSNLTVSYSDIRQNTNTSPIGDGGGIAIDNGVASIDHTNVLGNSTTRNGSGMLVVYTDRGAIYASCILSNLGSSAYVQPTYVLTAKNSWWGDAAGPLVATPSTGVRGSISSSAIAVTPFATSGISCGASATQATATPSPTATRTPLPTATRTPTPTRTPTRTPTITPTRTPQVSSFTYRNLQSSVVTPNPTDNSFNLALMPTNARGIIVQANTNPNPLGPTATGTPGTPVGSVRFNIGGTISVDNSSPYRATAVSTPGTYIINAVPYNRPNASGTPFGARSSTIIIINPTPTPTYAPSTSLDLNGQNSGLKAVIFWATFRESNFDAVDSGSSADNDLGNPRFSSFLFGSPYCTPGSGIGDNSVEPPPPPNPLQGWYIRHCPKDYRYMAAQTMLNGFLNYERRFGINRVFEYASTNFSGSIGDTNIGLWNLDPQCVANIGSTYSTAFAASSSSNSYSPAISWLDSYMQCIGASNSLNYGVLRAKRAFTTTILPQINQAIVDFYATPQDYTDAAFQAKVINFGSTRVLVSCVGGCYINGNLTNIVYTYQAPQDVFNAFAIPIGSITQTEVNNGYTTHMQQISSYSGDFTSVAQPVLITSTNLTTGDLVGYVWETEIYQQSGNMSHFPR